MALVARAWGDPRSGGDVAAIVAERARDDLYSRIQRSCRVGGDVVPAGCGHVCGALRAGPTFKRKTPAIAGALALVGLLTAADLFGGLGPVGL